MNINHFSNLNIINLNTNHIYSNINYNISHQHNEYNNYLLKYYYISSNISNIIVEFNNIINDRNTLDIEDPDIYSNIDLRIDNIITIYNLNINEFNILKNNINNLKFNYNNTLNLYNNELLSNVNLINEKTLEIKDLSVSTDKPIYNIRLFSILLNKFITFFNFLKYNERLEHLSIIKKEYLNFIHYLFFLNKAFIISNLHQIYVTPILLLSSNIETIILKDNFINIKNINNYYGNISPHLINYKINLLSDNIRSNLIDNSKPIYKHISNEIIQFNPDFRNKTYEIEIIATSILESEIKYKIILIENGFPEIKPYNTNSNIKLRDNFFSFHISDYYNNDVLFMIETSNITLSNLNSNYEFIYNSDIINYSNTPIISDHIIITPYFSNYPIIFEEYSNTPIILNIINAPEITSNYFIIELEDRIPYEFDLKQINTWYININDSIITYEFLDQDINNINIESNILIIYPNFRNITYNLKIEIETENDYSRKNIIYFQINENQAPKPIRTQRNLLLQHLLLKEDLTFNANNYFNTTTNEILAFDYYVSNIYNHTCNIELTILPDNTFNITTNSNLKFTPNYRNISYELYIYAIDTVYNVRSDSYLRIKIREDKLLHKIDDILPYFDLTNNIITFNINDHINIPTPYIYTNKYSINTTNIRKNKINNNDAVYIHDNGNVYIEADFRNESYIINVLVEAYNNMVLKDSIIFTFSVEEIIAPYPKIRTENIYIPNTNYNKNTKTLTINNLITTSISIDLNTFFINEIAYSTNKYEIITGNTDYYNITNNNLIIIPNVRNTIYYFSIICKDNNYNTYNNNELLNIEVIELPAITLNKYSDNYTLSNIEKIIDLSTIFISTINGVSLNYTIDTSVSTTLYNNILTINPEYRGISYTINVEGSNINYPEDSKNYIINITELEPLPINTKIDLIEINVERFIYNQDNIEINLEEIFENFRYYTYSFELTSDILNFNSIISIEENNILRIKNFNHEFNFIVDIKIVELLNNIKINFIRNSRSLTFTSTLNNFIITLDEIGNNYIYEIVGLNGVNVSSIVSVENNIMTILKSEILLEYNFVINMRNTELNLIKKQIFYRIDKNLV